jgi:tetratricopeptide (TPR) repeat protein
VADHDFQVQIGAGDARGYQVTMRAPDGGEAAITMRLPSAPELKAMAARIPDAVLASSAQVRGSMSSEEQPVHQLGQLLFDALLTGDGLALLVASRHVAMQRGEQLRMVLRVGPPELAGLPWEFLFDTGEGSYLCLTTPLIRHPQVLSPVRPLRVVPPLRILCMIARPDDQEALATHVEQQRLQRALADLEAEDWIELGWVAGQTWRDLRDAVRRNERARTGPVELSGPWHVFHFIGHGGFDAVAQEGTLALAGEDGRTFHLGAEKLATVLSGHPSLRLVVLNACDTGRASALDPFSSVAGALMRKGIPAVLAMQYPISDQAAIECSRTFYEGLAHQLPVDAAVMEARQSIWVSLGSLEWGTPVLYMRSLAGYLFDLAGTGQTRDRTTEISQTPQVGPLHAATNPSEAELDDLYTQGLGALYTQRWEAAIEAFRVVIARDRTYKNSQAHLEQARRGQQLAAMYGAGSGAVEAGDWAEAVEHLGAVVTAEPSYRDALALLEQARLKKAIAQLRTEAAALHRAQHWQAVLAVGERLKQLAPDAPDLDDLTSAAHAELNAQTLAEHYQQALQHMDASRWRQALQALAAIQQTDPDYRDSAQLAERARRGLLVSARGSQPAQLSPVHLTTIRTPKDFWASFSAGHTHAVAFSPDATRLALACDWHLVLITDLTGRLQLKIRHGRYGKVWDVAYNSDGRWLATASQDMTARIWDTTTGRELLKITHTGEVRGVAFSPDGTLLATASNDKTARISDTTTGRELLKITRDDLFGTVAFSPDGALLASLSDNQEFQLWQLNRESNG